MLWDFWDLSLLRTVFFSDIPNEDPSEEEVLEAGGEVKDEAC